LKRLCLDRLGDGVDLGAPRDWVRAAAYVSAMLDHAVNVQTVTARLQEFGFPLGRVHRGDLLHTGWQVDAAARAGVLTKSARIFGDLVRLTTEERQRLKIRCIDAIDEPAAQRRRRPKAEAAKRSRAKRSASYTPREQSEAKTEPWVVTGISRRTWYRQKKNQTDLALIRGPAILSKNIALHETVPTDANVHEIVPNSEDRDAA
ncbi:MAG TPA: hypothetical protein VL133_06325, partial [Devosia sp.]|nr:hypothetical protein [Devosia sp.]